MAGGREGVLYASSNHQEPPLLTTTSQRHEQLCSDSRQLPQHHWLHVRWAHGLLLSMLLTRFNSSWALGFSDSTPPYPRNGFIPPEQPSPTSVLQVLGSCLCRNSAKILLISCLSLYGSLCISLTSPFVVTLLLNYNHNPDIQLHVALRHSVVQGQYGIRCQELCRWRLL